MGWIKKQHVSEFDFLAGEILLMDKPLNWTSFDVVNKVRIAIKKHLGQKCKVGHGGTLDPLATGLMILASGKATKQLQSLTNLDKSYEATIYLGAETPSYDRETEVSQTYGIDHITEAKIREAARQFEGETSQMPPVFSAIKQKGKALYKSARKGEFVQPFPRQVVIHNLEIVAVDLPEVTLKITCSKGTYIRSLAYDLGKALDSGAYLSQLRRTAIGEYRIEDAFTVDEFVDLLYQKPA